MSPNHGRDRSTPSLALPSALRPLLRLAGGAPARELTPLAAEARAVVQHCLESETIQHLVALGSAYVYRLTPGNANRLGEGSELEFRAEAAELRAWVDSDLVFQAEAHGRRLCVSLLRVPIVVASDGELLLSPFRSDTPGHGLRRLGFDPMCPLITEHDAVRAVLLAVRAQRGGVFNIAGAEAVPLSRLARWVEGRDIAVPELVQRLLSLELPGWTRSEQRGGQRATHLRYGFTLDTRRAQRELGFAPHYRIRPDSAGSGGLEVCPAAQKRA